jgi:protein-serine/threonine kinase
LVNRKQYRDDGYGSNRLGSETDLASASNIAIDTNGETYNINHVGEWEPYSQSSQQDVSRPTRDQSLRPNQRRFGDAYDHGHGGSSSATRRVMDFFRRRGKDRSEV